MSNWLRKAILGLMSAGVRDELKRWRFSSQIHRRTFASPEPEFALIGKLLRHGDIAIDVGANVGHYTLRMAEFVGDSGRVIAFEPMPETFELLAANVRAARAYNVTLFNAAVSSRPGFVAMDLPQWEHGGDNYYMARISDTGNYRCLCMRIDDLQLPRIALLKVDAEGHDMDVLRGAEMAIRRDLPTIIVETALRSEVTTWLESIGYSIEQLPGSPNCLAVARRDLPRDLIR